MGIPTSVSCLEEDVVACGVITDVDGTEGPLPSGAAQYARVLSLKHKTQCGSITGADQSQILHQAYLDIKVDKLRCFNFSTRYLKLIETVEQGSSRPGHHV